jgi:hypothetical protein
MAGQVSVLRFALAKYLYVSAHENIKAPMTGRMVATHNLDFAIEMTLKTIATEVNETVRYGIKFDELWGQVDSAYSLKYNKPLPLKTEIEKIHFARNRVQHEGSVPSDDDLEQYFEHVTNFLEEVLLTVTGRGLNQTYLSSIINNTDLKRTMELAEKNLSSDPKSSMIASMKAFGWAKLLAQRQLGFFDPTLGVFDMHDEVQRKMEEPLTHIVESLVDRLSSVELEIEPIRHNKVLSVAPSPYIAIRTEKIDDIHILETIPSNYTEPNAWFCYDFALENILRWQSRKMI